MATPRHILLGYNQEFLPTFRTGPKGAWKLLSEQWKRPESIGLVRFFRLLICVAIFFLPTIYMDLLVPTKPHAADVDGQKVPGRSKAGVAVARETYYAAVFAFLLVALFRDFHSSIVVIALIIYVLADILIHLCGQVFVWGGLSIDASRSLLLALINYFEMTIGFAVLYRHWDCLSICPLGAMQALYFSLVTGATVGYGDIVPATDAGKTLVMAQIATAFVFVAVIISTLLGRATTPNPSGASQT